MTRYLSSVYKVQAARAPTAFAAQGVTPSQLAQQTTARVFDEADTNRDGKLSIEEFTEWTTRPGSLGPEISKLATESIPPSLAADRIHAQAQAQAQAQARTTARALVEGQGKVPARVAEVPLPKGAAPPGVPASSPIARTDGAAQPVAEHGLPPVLRRPPSLKDLSPASARTRRLTTGTGASHAGVRAGTGVFPSQGVPSDGDSALGISAGKGVGRVGGVAPVAPAGLARREVSH